jgi:hypothetical protein
MKSEMVGKTRQVFANVLDAADARILRNLEADDRASPWQRGRHAFLAVANWTGGEIGGIVDFAIRTREAVSGDSGAHRWVYSPCEL